MRSGYSMDRRQNCSNGQKVLSSLKYERGCQANPDFLEVAVLRIIGFFVLGALLHRPARGLSDRPLETFGAHILSAFWKCLESVPDIPCI